MLYQTIQKAQGSESRSIMALLFVMIGFGFCKLESLLIKWEIICHQDFVILPQGSSGSLKCQVFCEGFSEGLKKKA